MTKIKESPCCPKKKKCCCCGEEGATELQCVWMHDALKRVCLDKTVQLRHGQITLRATATRGRIVVKTGMYLSGEWRMFLHAADLTVVFLSTVLVLRSLHVQPYARTHTVHPFIRTPLSLLPEQKRGNTRTHRTTLLYDGQDRTNRYLVTLMLLSSPLPS